MSVTVPVIGQTSWGDEANAAFEALASSGFNPNAMAYKQWVYDPAAISAAVAPVSGTVVSVLLPRLTDTATLTGLVFSINVIATLPTAGQCFVGLYDAATGTQLAVSADISGQLATTGLRQFAFTAPYVAAAGNYIAAILQNATTSAQLGHQSAIGIATIPNGGLTASAARFATGPVAQTTLPASITLASRTLSANTTFAGSY